MVRRLSLAALFIALLAGPATAKELRIASINLCTDQLLLDLAEPRHILGLSPFARDSARSWAAARAAGVPVLSGTAEEIMMQRPSLVLAGRFTRRATREFIRARAIPLEEFDVVRTLPEARDQIRRVAALVGRPEQGEARVAELDAALARLKAAGAGQRLRVLPLARRGWASGRDSLMTELLSAAGLVNAADGTTPQLGGFMSLEAIVKLRPDALLIALDDGTAKDQGQALLLHPAIQALFPAERRIAIPESLTICGGPMLTEAMDRLAAEVRGLKPREADLR
jgi:iron complex transport system substrate-binding protein